MLQAVWPVYSGGFTTPSPCMQGGYYQQASNYPMPTYLAPTPTITPINAAVHAPIGTKCPIPSETYYELKGLKKKNKELETKLGAACKLIANSGLFTAHSSGGLIKRKGGKPKAGSEKDTERREERARGVLVCSKLIQGDAIASNIFDLCVEAVKQEPKVKNAMMDFLCHHAGATTSDNRFKTGERVQEQEALISKRNAFRVMVSSYMKQSCFDALRKYGGNRLVDNANSLQEWAVDQPEMPRYEFVEPGRSTAVFTPLKELIEEKLMKCDAIVQSLRKCHPYKPGDTLITWMVSSPSHHARQRN